MITSPTKDCSPLLIIAIYAVILLCCTVSIGDAKAVGSEKFVPGNVSMTSPPSTPSPNITAGTTPGTDLSPLLQEQLRILDRVEGRPSRGRKRVKRWGDICQNKAEEFRPTGNGSFIPLWQVLCSCYEMMSLAYPKDRTKEYAEGCPKYGTFPTTTTTTTTTTPTPIYGSFTCFACDNGRKKNDRCLEGSTHPNWDMKTSSRCSTVDEFFTTYSTIGYEFAKRYPHAQKRETLRSMDGILLHPTVHLCVAISETRSYKKGETKVMRGCIYGHNMDIEKQFFNRFKDSPKLEGVGGMMVLPQGTCREKTIGPKGKEVEVKLCACNNHEKCNYDQFAGAGLVGPIRLWLLLGAALTLLLLLI